jgi:hypothetical protein
VHPGDYYDKGGEEGDEGFAETDFVCIFFVKGYFCDFFCFWHAFTFFRHFRSPFMGTFVELV